MRLIGIVSLIATSGFASVDPQLHDVTRIDVPSGADRIRPSDNGRSLAVAIYKVDRTQLAIISPNRKVGETLQFQREARAFGRVDSGEVVVNRGKTIDLSRNGVFVPFSTVEYPRILEAFNKIIAVEKSGEIWVWHDLKQVLRMRLPSTYHTVSVRPDGNEVAIVTRVVNNGKEASQLALYKNGRAGTKAIVNLKSPSGRLLAVEPTDVTCDYSDLNHLLLFVDEDGFTPQELSYTPTLFRNYPGGKDDPDKIVRVRLIAQVDIRTGLTKPICRLQDQVPKGGDRALPMVDQFAVLNDNHVAVLMFDSIYVMPITPIDVRPVTQPLKQIKPHSRR